MKTTRRKNRERRIRHKRNKRETKINIERYQASAAYIRDYVKDFNEECRYVSSSLHGCASPYIYNLLVKCDACNHLYHVTSVDYKDLNKRCPCKHGGVSEVWFPYTYTDKIPGEKCIILGGFYRPISLEGLGESSTSREASEVWLPDCPYRQVPSWISHMIG